MGARKLLVCSGSHCRKSRRKELDAALSRLPVKVERVGCQKVCRGPVVGLRIAGEWQWFERMDSRKAVDALSELVARDALPKPLRKRRSGKRAGKRRP